MRSFLSLVRIETENSLPLPSGCDQQYAGFLTGAPKHGMDSGESQENV